MLKNLTIWIIAVATVLPIVASAKSEEIFEARVLEIIAEESKTREDGSTFIQQNIKAVGLEGDYKDKEFIFYGISDIEVTSAKIYKIGDRVQTYQSTDSEGNENFYIIDFVRRPVLYGFFILFTFIVLAVARWKGLKSLLGLAASFLIIIKFIVPRILAGGSPLWIGVVGSFAILALIIYLNEGVKKRSHVAILSIFLALLATAVLSMLFTALARITGMAQEETMYLMSFAGRTLNFQGLLLAGVLIGTLGVLDDVVISQIETVNQIKEANPRMPRREAFNRSLTVGNAHVGAVVNTLFLAYAGASLPLLLLFGLDIPPFLSFRQIINNELIATEILRMLVGSIGLILAMPLSTFLATYLIRGRTSVQPEVRSQ